VKQLTAISNRISLSLFYGFGVFTVMALLLAFKTEQMVLAALPLVVLLGAITILDFKSVYFFLLAMLPLSIEYYFPSGLGTDLPTEPLMVGMMLVAFVFIFFKREALPDSFFINPLVIALLFHYLWIFICALNSENVIVSVKIFLAKTWYITTFTVLTAVVIRTKGDLKKIFWCIYIPLTILITITMLRHGILYHFYFQDINKCVTPYFRNHVNYAAMVSVFFPFLFLAIGWYEKGSKIRKLLVFSVIYYVVAIYFSFTRTCMLAVLAMIPFYFMVKWRFTKLGLIAIAGFVVFTLNTLISDNKYMHMSPDFEKTVYHDDFSSHLTSTFEGADVSSMERIYRWIAAARMSVAHPYMGVGSGNFYDNYKHFTVTSFETYISDNEEHSTVHNYFLLMLVEQGYIGLFIFIALTATVFIYGERVYFKMKTSESRRTVMILLLVMLSVYVNLLLSDMLETDKVGPFFFMTLALLVLFDTEKISVEAESE
jgi:O-antigen ligase